MPHIKGNPGTTAGTVHHCPGRKIGAYVKMGPCRGKKETGYCLTHQIPCLAPECRQKHWAKLKNEPCSLCEQRQKRADQAGIDARRVANEAKVQDRLDNKEQKRGGRR
ncbi:MAG: hypothetical protein ALECFALPRED_006495 [Alectoria fallacina]|uniref:Uncharacterized protein n=1 Tax=Alectoria fallacina TaxID=1903189 RepID=A0A8H3G6D0_9LECA|nr:MAG: hypothetical protein ALECFALPRED_006495 [Alectoria fallacina]